MSSKRKGLLVILDGLGDRPHPKLNGKTPLEAAATPVMDSLVQRGQCGMMDPVMPGVPVATHTGTAILMGMPAADAAHLHRGPVEALGVGLETQPGDILIRCNFAHLENEGQRLMIRDRRAGRIMDQTEQLTSLLQSVQLPGGIEACVSPATQHRATLRLRGKNLSTQISDTDPGNGINVPLNSCQPTADNDPAARITAEAINHFIHVTHRRLIDHPINKNRINRGLPPANGLITRGAGRTEACESLLQHLELAGCLVTSEATVVGVGKMLGYQVLENPAFTADCKSDLDAKFAAARQALETNDLVVVHIKATDICAHDLDPEEKRRVIERADTALSGFDDPDLVIGITGDHSTDSNTGRHTGDPVPSLISGPDMRPDMCTSYGEATCLQGGLGRIPGNGFFASLLDQMNQLGQLKPDECRFFL